jgi:mannosyltransferase
MFPLDWLPRISGWILYISASQMAGNAYYPDSSDRYTVMLLIVSMALCLVALLAWGECSRTRRGSVEPWRLGVLWCWLIVPPALMFAASLIQPMFVFRYLLVSLPAMALVTASGLARVRPNWASLLTILLVVSLGSPGLIRYYRYRSGFQEWRAVASKMLANSRPGDGAIFCIAPGRLLVDYYGQQMHATAMPEPVYPAFPGFNQDPRALDYLPSWTDATLKAAASSHERMWLIVYHDFFGTTQRARDHLKAILESAYSQSDNIRIDGVTVNLYTRSFPPEPLAHPSDQIASENSKPPARRGRN